MADVNEEQLQQPSTEDNLNNVNSSEELDDDDDDEFRSHSFRERRLTYSRHHILSDNAAAAVAELLAEGIDDDDDDDDDKIEAAVTNDNKNEEEGGRKDNEEATTFAAATESTSEDLASTTATTSNNKKRRRRSTESSSASNSNNTNELISSNSSFYLPSRILHAGEIVRRFSGDHSSRTSIDDNATHNNGKNEEVTTDDQQHDQHDVRTGVYSHPTHHATSKNYHHHHHHYSTNNTNGHHHHHQQQQHQQHRNKWKQRFSFCSTTPDYILPFPRNVVGTFSCHGMEPVYDSDYDDDSEEEEEGAATTVTATTAAKGTTTIAKINQDRGGVIYPYANSHNMALFAVYDGHGEGGELVSQFALGEVSRILGGMLLQHDGDKTKLLGKKDDEKKKVVERIGGERKRRRGGGRMRLLESVNEEDTTVAPSTSDGISDNHDDNKPDDNDEEEGDKVIEQSLKETFIKVDRGLLDEAEIEPMYSGTTACVVLMRHTKLYIANCGDSRAVLARRTSSTSTSLSIIPLSIDQNPDSPGEKERIIHSGGYVSPPPEPGLSARVWLDANMTQIGLAMARSIGDHAVKGVGVIAEPVVSVHNIDEELDEFVIIATDGVWEFISSEDAVDIVGRHLMYDDDDDNDASEKNVHDEGGGMTMGGASEACEALIKAATAKWQEFEGDYRDDITAMVIRLKDLRVGK
jgi:protein phosphatase 2C family protein 2/3